MFLYDMCCAAAKLLLQDALNWCHTARIAIGSPPQYFNAVVDVSTSDLIVPSPSSRTGYSPPLHVYNSSLSSTYQPNGTEISSDPLGIRTSGFLSQDDLHISDLLIEDILFEEATDLDFEECMYCNWNYDTVLPLGIYHEDSSRNFMSPIARLNSDKILDENVFSMRLSRNTRDGEGQLILGGRIDESFSEGSEFTVPLTDLNNEWVEKTNWKVKADSLILGTDHFTFQDSTVAVFHTVVSWIVLPSKLAKRLNRSLGAKHFGSFAFVDCAQRPRFPDLTIILAGQRFVLTPYDYIIEQNESGRISCMSAFLQDVEEDGVIFLGSAFLKTWVTVWDWQHRTIGCKRFILKLYILESHLLSSQSLERSTQFEIVQTILDMIRPR